MRRFSLIFLFFVTVLAPALQASALGGGGEEIFSTANQAYKEGRFQDAIAGYGQLIAAGYEDGHLYYNMGNAFFRMERLGWAILYYQKALLLIPRDADLKFNLGYARDLMKDAVDYPQSYIRLAFFWVDSLNLHELFRVFAAVNLLFWGVLLARLFHRVEWTYYLYLAVLILWALSGISFGIKQYLLYTDNRAVILEKEVDVMAGPSGRDTVLFKLHDGTVVRRERTEDGWMLVSLPDGKRGWVSHEVARGITDKTPQPEDLL